MMTRKRILLALAAVLVLIQFIRIDKINPPVDPKLDFSAAAHPPPEVLTPHSKRREVRQLAP